MHVDVSKSERYNNSFALPKFLKIRIEMTQLQYWYLDKAWLVLI